MAFSQDYSGVNEAGDFSPAPAGIYRLKVVETKEGQTRNGDNKVDVTLKIIGGRDSGKKVWNTVSFLAPDAPGAGFSKHFLRVISQPFEGRVNVDPMRWMGQEFMARLDVEDYENKHRQMRKKNVIEDSWHLEDEECPKEEVFATSGNPALSRAAGMTGRQPAKTGGQEAEVPF